MKHLYVIQDNDHIIAEDCKEALALWTKETGLTVADLDDGEDDIVEIPDSRIISAWVQDGEIAEHNTGTLAEKAAIEWADQYPKGLLFSTEY
jgi:hypothetical protein